MRRARACAVPLVALGVATACGGPELGVGSARDVQVQLESQAPFTRAPDFEERVRSTLQVAVEYWGGTMASLEDRTVVLVDSPSVECGGRPSLGCFDGDIRLTTRDPGTGTVACIEQTVLVHEVGHAVIGDGNHTDPRWMEMDEVAARLSGRPGYGEQGEAPCTIHPSVWRHPLGSP